MKEANEYLIKAKRREITMTLKRSGKYCVSNATISSVPENFNRQQKGLLFVVIMYNVLFEGKTCHVYTMLHDHDCAMMTA